MELFIEFAILVEPRRIVLEYKPIPQVGPCVALFCVATITICGDDVRILKGEHPVASRLSVGHVPRGVIEQLGFAVLGV